MKNETLLFRIRFGLRIRQIRIEKQIEQAALASDLNKDKQFIGRYENEGANPRADIVQELATALHVNSIDELFDFSRLNKTDIDKIYNKLKKNGD